ncbi:CDP-2,3-bis-(O-geranylgeranyl)-sn-glycerol synthase [Patescibacteria group bacterium]
MLDLIISSLYFILPAYVANMCPVIFGKLKFPFGKPISKKLFGAHKTYRGIYVAYFGALLTLFIQQKLALTEISLLDYGTINLWLYAFLFGIGAIVGDLVKSYIKRRINIKPGDPWIPFDQLDFIVGALLFLAPLYVPSWEVILVIVIATPLLHLLTNVLGYVLRIKKVWW